MESFCRPPQGLSFEGNVAENWRRFIQLFNIYMKASANDKKDPDVKVALFLNAAGEVAVEVYNTFNLSEEDKNDYEKVIKEFESFTTPKKNIVVERFVFNKRNQEEGEPFDGFVTDLKKLVKSCDFGEQSDSVVRDRIVLGVTDLSLQERMLRETDLSLKKAIELGKAAELSRMRAQTIQSKSIDLIQKNSTNSARPTMIKSKPQRRDNVSGERNNELACRNCNRKHVKGQCPAYGKQCFKCHNFNHFSAVCRFKQVHNVSMKDRNDAVESNEGESDFFVDSLTVMDSIKYINFDSVQNVKSAVLKEWTKTFNIEGKSVTFKLDTGAEVNILPLNILKILQTDYHIQKCNIILEAFGGSRIKPIGSAVLNCLVDGIHHPIKFLIIDGTPARPLLGLEACMKLDLIQFINNVEIPNKGKLDQYVNVLISPKEKFILNNLKVFEGVGKFKGTCKIKVKDQVTPIVKPPRRIPLSLKPKLEKKLTELESQGIITRVDQPTSWVSNIVIVEKANGTIRICLDPLDLNKVIKRDHVLIPTIEEILPKLANKSVYSVLDLKDGFFQIELDTESSELCTFSTPVGCYKFLRLPMGISCAPEIFQKRNQENFGDIPGVLVYFDDLLIAASSLEEHDKILEQVVKRAKELNIKFNKQKLQYRVTEVKYLGHLFNASGMQPDPDRVKAIVEIREPKNKLELQRILGLFNYLRRFVPNFSTITAPLRQLLKQNVEWQWLQLHTKTLNELKELISNAPVLGIFDSNKSVTIQADSSKDGLGCCLLQNGQPIAFSSRSLTSAEQNYAQIEKEFLSILFAANKFHYYIYGREVEVLTDHKPLVSIMNKNVANILSNRLQRIKIKLLKYQLKLKYLPGKFMYIADLLSRSFIDSQVQNEDVEMTEVVHTLTKQLQMSESRKKEFREATLRDEGLKIILEYWQKGWPFSVDKISCAARPYFKFKNDLSIEQGLVFYKDRVVVPISLRKYMLSILHEAHCGVEKSKARARQVMFWPGINDDIENMILKCVICDKYRPQTIKEPLICHSLPNLPFEKIGINICEYGGRSYLVLGCYLTKWLEIMHLRNKRAEEVISKLKLIFSIHGIPKIVICDNMPFNSWEMRKFAKEWCFEIITSSPRYPKSNGFAERMVGIAKGILRKSGPNSLYEALLEYRCTPISGIGISPCQMLMSRNLRTKLPITQSELKPLVQKGFKSQLINKQKKVKFYYDRNAQIRPEFSPGEKVMLRVGSHWEPATIIEKHSTPRSYLIKNQNNRIVRRNKCHIRKTQSQPNLVFHDYNDLCEDDSEQGINNTLQTDPYQQSNDSNLIHRTRSGRNVRLPLKYKNYVM